VTGAGQAGTGASKAGASAARRVGGTREGSTGRVCRWARRVDLSPAKSRPRPSQRPGELAQHLSYLPKPYPYLQELQPKLHVDGRSSPLSTTQNSASNGCTVTTGPDSPTHRLSSSPSLMPIEAPKHAHGVCRENEELPYHLTLL
jgi:hypothetical protein